MPTLLQINVTANWGSTGKIAEQIGVRALQLGWKSYLAYGRNSNPSQLSLIKVGNIPTVLWHYAANRLFDREGLESRLETRKFVEKIKEINPDIIHLHNIHDHWLNYPLLFQYLATLDIPIVWTQHDCWAFTGGCFHYTIAECEKWMSKCGSCKQKRSLMCDRTSDHYGNKQRLFLQIKNLTLVPVSIWLEGELKKSFFRDHHICTIHNGVDVSSFCPRPSSDIRTRFGMGNGNYVMAVASAWSERKGLSDYIRLSRIVDDSLKIVLVGVTEKQAKTLPKSIITVPRTQNVEELAQLYTEASIILNLSYEETFGLTTVEGFACGTPGIVYNSTASPELISEDTGVVVEKGDVEAVSVAIRKILLRDKSYYSIKCRDRAVQLYDKNKNFDKYLDLYHTLLKNRKSVNTINEMT